jgi:hypothetical protein
MLHYLPLPWVWHSQLNRLCYLSPPLSPVIVNWKSELTQWLPSVRCVYYVGNKVGQEGVLAGVLHQE